jgi:hypothetical protein
LPSADGFVHAEDGHPGEVVAVGEQLPVLGNALSPRWRARWAARRCSWRLTLIVRPDSAVVHWARSGQPWHWAPKVAVPLPSG